MKSTTLLTLLSLLLFALAPVLCELEACCADEDGCCGDTSICHCACSAVAKVEEKVVHTIVLDAESYDFSMNTGEILQGFQCQPDRPPIVSC